jgi:hypothetical protein
MAPDYAEQEMTQRLLKPVQVAMSRRLRKIMAYVAAAIPSNCPHCGGAISMNWDAADKAEN